MSDGSELGVASDRELAALTSALFPSGDIAEIERWCEGRGEPCPGPVRAEFAERLLERLRRRAELGQGRPRERSRLTFRERKEARVQRRVRELERRASAASTVAATVSVVAPERPAGPLADNVVPLRPWPPVAAPVSPRAWLSKQRTKSIMDMEF